MSRRAKMYGGKLVLCSYGDGEGVCELLQYRIPTPIRSREGFG
jgi:hypothetical protein